MFILDVDWFIFFLIVLILLFVRVFGILFIIFRLVFIGEILGVFGILIVFRDNEDIFLFIEDFMRFEMFVVMVGEEIFKFELLVGIFFFCFWILCKLLS